MSPNLKRRSFLKTAGMMPFIAIAGFDAGVIGRAMYQKPVTRPGGAKLKLSLNAYSFNDLLTEGLKGGEEGISLFDLLDFCAQHNFDAIDPTGYYFPGYPGIPSDNYINEFKRRAFQLGLDISGTGVRNNFAIPDSDKRRKEIELVKKWIEVAARMGAPVIRVFAGAVPEGYEDRWREVAQWMAAALKECVVHAQKFGVLLGIQNHGDMLKTADETLEILKMVDSEWFGVIVDTGNFRKDDPYAEIARVMPYAVNWQIKESPYGNTSSVRMDLNRLIPLIIKSGYRGYIPIETLSIKGRPYDPYQLVPAFLNDVRDAIKNAI